MSRLHTRPTKGRRIAGLTPTQVILLKHAVAGPIRMLRGDRLGTRCAGYDEASGAALMVAYCTPEYFLVARGLLQRRNAPHTYDITDAGRAAIAKAEGGAA